MALKYSTSLLALRRVIEEIISDALWRTIGEDVDAREAETIMVLRCYRDTLLRNAGLILARPHTIRRIRQAVTRRVRSKKGGAE